MFTVYILLNTLMNRHYIGSTGDLKRRIIEHNRGQIKSTRFKGEWKLVHQEDFENKLEVKRRERHMKSYKGGNAFKKLLRW